jgi:hypothetical protein
MGLSSVTGNGQRTKKALSSEELFLLPFSSKNKEGHLGISMGIAAFYYCHQQPAADIPQSMDFERKVPR